MKIQKKHSLIKTEKDLGEIRSCRLLGEALDKAEEKIESAKENFEEAENSIKKLTGLVLYPYNDNGLRKFFWSKSYGGVSGLFDNRAAAIRALIDDNIEWE